MRKELFYFATCRKFREKINQMRVTFCINRDKNEEAPRVNPVFLYSIHICVCTILVLINLAARSGSPFFLLPFSIFRLLSGALYRIVISRRLYVQK